MKTRLLHLASSDGVPVLGWRDARGVVVFALRLLQMGSDIDIDIRR
jgi:hypothetical protein